MLVEENLIEIYVNRYSASVLYPKCRGFKIYSWQKERGKTVFICFRNDNKRPFAFAHLVKKEIVEEEVKKTVFFLEPQQSGASFGSERRGKKRRHEKNIKPNKR